MRMNTETSDLYSYLASLSILKHVLYQSDPHCFTSIAVTEIMDMQIQHKNEKGESSRAELAILFIIK